MATVIKMIFVYIISITFFIYRNNFSTQKTCWENPTNKQIVVQMNQEINDKFTIFLNIKIITTLTFVF